MNAEGKIAAARPVVRRRRRWKRWAALLVLVLAGVAAWGYMALRPPPDPLQGLALYTVARGDIEDAVLAQGTLEASELVSIGAQVSGIVKSVAVGLGDDVKTGDLIAEIDPTDKQNAVRSAEAALANLAAQKTARETDRQKAARALERAQRLSGNNVISAADLEAAQSQLQSAEAQIAAIAAQMQQAEVQLETARVDLSRTRIVAPMAGTVVAVLADAGQAISAQASSPTVAKIANLDKMLIRTKISEADITRVKPGQAVHFTVLGAPDRPIKATLTSIDPAPRSIATTTTTSTTTTDAVYYDGIVEVPNPDRSLRISMTAEVNIVLKASTGALLVPASALRRAGPDAYLVSIVNAAGVPEDRPVKVGINNKVMAEILDGLREGDRVVGGAGLTGPAGTGVSTRAGGFNVRMAGGPPPPR